MSFYVLFAALQPGRYHNPNFTDGISENQGVLPARKWHGHDRNIRVALANPCDNTQSHFHLFLAWQGAGGGGSGVDVPINSPEPDLPRCYLADDRSGDRAS